MKKILLGALLLLSTITFSQSKTNYVSNDTIFFNEDKTITEKKLVNYQVYDIQGRLVKKGFSDKVDISDVSYGIYILILVIDENNKITKFYKTEK